MKNEDIDKILVNYLRVTSCLEINEANSGHPGICLGSAPILYSIFKNAKINPTKPNFINRDRIVFSAGHASALVYACLHLFGFDVNVDDLKQFRKLGSITTGHPEVNVAPGIDCSTGPLGQGVGMSVGFAVAEEFLRNKYSKGNLQPINHYTYCFVGDGCLMEGVAQEAISLAGNLRLNHLIMLYDKNDITIEGSTEISNKENVKNKFLACNWNVLEVQNGNSVAEIDSAINEAKHSDKPTLIVVKTKIGYGSELEGTNTVHGKPLNSEQINVLRTNLNYMTPDWDIPQNTIEYLTELNTKYANEYREYYDMLNEYKNKFPQEFISFNELDNNWNYDFATLPIQRQEEKFDGRKAIHNFMNALYEVMPTLIGGSADLSPSTKTNFDECGYFNYLNRTNRNIAYGIREHAMGAISNGIALHGGLRSFCSTFMSFENYMTPAIRLSALMKNPVLYIFTHDSFFVGEDGPTHHPIEQMATLRAMPNLNVFRPCGENELLAAGQTFFHNHLPMALLIPRQVGIKLNDSYEGALSGAYEIKTQKDNELIIVATGSEVDTAIKVSDILKANKVICNVVSMPCEEIFNKMPQNYKDKVINRNKKVFCIEASSDNIWYKYASKPNYVLNINEFSQSAKAEDLAKYLHFTPEQLANRILKILQEN